MLKHFFRILIGIKLVVMPLGVNQIPVGSGFNDMPVFEDEDPVAVDDCGQTMGYDKGRPSLK